MCGLACRQVLQRPSALFAATGQVSLTELRNCRYRLGETLSDRKKAQSPTSLFASTGCISSTYRLEALHASVQRIMAGKAKSDLKLSSAPVWIDCDAGSDDALGIAPLPAPPEEQLYPKHTMPLQAFFWLLSQTLWGYHLYGGTRYRETNCVAADLFIPVKGFLRAC